MNDRLLPRVRPTHPRWGRWAQVLAPPALVGATALVAGAAAASIPEPPPLPGRLVYTRATAFAWDLYAADANGANELRLSSSRDANPVGEDQPRWSPDGREIVFTTLTKDGDRAFIWRMPFSGGTPTPVATANAEGRATRHGTRPARPSCSPVRTTGAGRATLTCACGRPPAEGRS